MSKINVNQIDQAGLSLFVQQASSGSAFSGNFTNFVASSGWIGPTALWITGGNQTVLGSKTFTGAIGVPYSGTTGQTVARLYVDTFVNLVSGFAQTSLNNSNNTLSGFLSSGLTATGATIVNSLNNLSGLVIANLFTTGSILSAVKVTGSSIIQIANFTGLGGTLVIYSGNQIFISGAAGTTVNDPMYVTGNQLVSGLKRFISGIEVLNSTSPSGAINFAFLSGVSGVLAAMGGGGGAPNAVFTTGDQTIGSVKTFTGTVLVPNNPTLPSGAVNLAYLSGVSGVLNAAILAGGGAPNAVFTTGDQTIGSVKTFTGTILVPDNPALPSGAVNLKHLLLVSGTLSSGGVGATINNFYITGTGTINNTFNSTGNITNTFNYNDTIITGNFIDVSFFLDPIATGLNLFEAHIAHGFTFTGAAFSCRTSGFGPVTGGGAAMSGKIYQVDNNNTEQTLYSFVFQSGLIYSGSPTFNIYVTGRNRVGLSISNSLSGIEKFAVGVFGGTYA